MTVHLPPMKALTAGRARDGSYPRAGAMIGAASLLSAD